MKIMRNILFIIAAVVFALPIAATIYMSFRNEGAFSLKGYADLLFDCFIFYPMFWNSLLYATVITAIELLIIIPCAFGFANARFKGKAPLFIFYIILMMMPLQVTVLPNYIGLREMGLLNTRLAIILPMIFSPFGVVVMRQYLESIEGSEIEACRLESNSVVRAIITAVVPQLRVCILAVVLFVFSECWNMVEQPILFLRDDSLKTLSVFISNAKSFTGNVLFPAGVLFMVPILLLYIFFNENLEKGLTINGFK